MWHGNHKAAPLSVSFSFRLRMLSFPSKYLSLEATNPIVTKKPAFSRLFRSKHHFILLVILFVGRSISRLVTRNYYPQKESTCQSFLGNRGDREPSPCLLIQTSKFFRALCLGHSLAFAGNLENHHDGKHHNQSAEESDQRVPDESRDDISHGRDSRAGQGIGHLGRDMVDVVALRAGGGHDCRVGNG